MNPKFIKKITAMKKIMLLSVVLFFTVLNGVIAQFANVNPIPSYNYHMTGPWAAFQESGSGTREKRDMDIEVKTSSDGRDEIFATVWIVKSDGSQILGPFTVYCNEILSVQLPNNGKWGANVNCNWQVNVSVWISKSPSRTLNDIPENNGNQVFPINNFLPTI